MTSDFPRAVRRVLGGRRRRVCHNKANRKDETMAKRYINEEHLIISVQI